jgi:hypothetical protein
LSREYSAAGRAIKTCRLSLGCRSLPFRDPDVRKLHSRRAGFPASEVEYTPFEVVLEQIIRSSMGVRRIRVPSISPMKRSSSRSPMLK